MKPLLTYPLPGTLAGGVNYNWTVPVKVTIPPFGTVGELSHRELETAAWKEAVRTRAVSTSSVKLLLRWTGYEEPSARKSVVKTSGLKCTNSAARAPREGVGRESGSGAN